MLNQLHEISLEEMKAEFCLNDIVLSQPDGPPLLVFLPDLSELPWF